MIVGGDNACSVPDSCKIDIDRRIVSGENHEKFLDELNEICLAIQQDIKNFKYSISPPFLNIKPLNTPLNSPLMYALQKASDEILGSHVIKAIPVFACSRREPSKDRTTKNIMVQRTRLCGCEKQT